MTETILTIFPNAADLLALDPEELGLLLLELVPGIMQNGMFYVGGFEAQMSPPVGPSYPQDLRRPIELAIAEAMSWLVTQGLIVQDPSQPAQWFRLTRRAQRLSSKADLAAYRTGLTLPDYLLQPILVEKVRPLFLRGDRDTAVFQAFKIVEVQVRNAANAKGARFPDDLVGVKLMGQAFNPDSGSLTDTTLVDAERKAMAALFVGAIGHCKNPPGHRDIAISPQRAARLIVFASHLLDLVDERTSANS